MTEDEKINLRQSKKISHAGNEKKIAGKAYDLMERHLTGSVS
eukprot:CAMPEP_0183311902 /NCGR_PEP_ID=MMETSP0160_2-20130417/39440_1 /TAXON_ID=2839 ORGANISM="Odontella Sinensis, Strain Grunow 1884" /NCGR_SAMPLE_ID=MMETSP0160_2 /ASSEMBLY_ACC=CAM_ASM_000250 /LENGTH=41 /DNA_ID= /DNA_START= /DNA_END= /DNA_ORIENTATION=